MSDCLFCGIAAGTVPADVIYQTDEVVAFRDLHPQAPLHALVIPRKHIATINDITPEDQTVIGEMYLAAAQIVGEAGLSESGFRTVMNCNRQGGQTVYHIHLHVLAGRQMHWPPG
ncbi:MAG: histidine triad nucleotide-binding protein [Pseudomonadota bacterium]|nr:histidine triad nucleotide-binding protein [Pseudomonadota bacterium]